MATRRRLVSNRYFEIGYEYRDVESAKVRDGAKEALVGRLLLVVKQCEGQSHIILYPLALQHQAQFEALVPQPSHLGALAIIMCPLRLVLIEKECRVVQQLMPLSTPISVFWILTMLGSMPMVSESDKK